MQMTEEMWKEIDGYAGIYEVSSLGRVRSIDRIVTMKNGLKRKTPGVVLKLNRGNGTGNYKSVSLSKDGIMKRFLVHRLVANAVVPNPDDLPEINHKDEDKCNNRADNLEWCDRKYNNLYGTAKARSAIKQGKPVIQKLNGKIVNAWPTAGMAAAFTDATQGGIDGCCRGKVKTSGGYEWEFAPWG